MGDYRVPRYNQGDMVFFRPSPNANKILGTVADSNFYQYGRYSYTREYTVIDARGKTHKVLSLWSDLKLHKRKQMVNK